MKRGDTVKINRGVHKGVTGTVERILAPGFGVKTERVIVQRPDGRRLNLATSSMEKI